MDISVVVPLYNEEESLPELYAWIERVMHEHHFTYEVIFVNDGSTDHSWQVIEELSRKSKEVKGIKKFFEEFKAFAMRGNVLDMAVGVVIGGAFTAIVTALVEDIINPLIGLFFKADFSDVVIGLGGSSIKIGEFVNSIINFLIVAFVLFVVIKFVNSLHKKPEEPAAPEEPTTKVCPYCQSEISIKAVRCPHCTSKLEDFPEMKA